LDERLKFEEGESIAGIRGEIDVESTTPFTRSKVVIFGTKSVKPSKQAQENQQILKGMTFNVNKERSWNNTNRPSEDTKGLDKGQSRLYAMTITSKG